MRLHTFSKRVAKEILRDPLTLIFGLGFPIIILLLLSAIQANIPVPLFEIQKLAPGITIFGLSFISLFTASLIARDKDSAFLLRLCTTPLTIFDFLFGYTLPMLPIAVAQCIVCYLTAIVLGLPVTASILIDILLIVPCALFFIALGIFCGSIFNTKQVGAICGALLTNLCAWLSGIWFDLELIGGAFKKAAYLLPFVHAVELQRAALGQDYSSMLPHLIWILGYAAGFVLLAGITFSRQIKNR